MHHYRKLVSRCTVCGEAYGHFRGDNGPSWLTILIVGHLAMPVVLTVEHNFELDVWIGLSIYLPLILVLQHE